MCELVNPSTDDGNYGIHHYTGAAEPVGQVQAFAGPLSEFASHFYSQLLL